MLRTTALILLLVSAVQGQDLAAQLAHIGGTTRPGHVAELTTQETGLTPEVRERLTAHLGRLELPKAILLLERLLPSICFALRHARAVPALLAACRDGRECVRNGREIQPTKRCC